MMIEKISRIVNNNLKSEINYSYITIGKSNNGVLFLKFPQSLTGMLRESLDAMIKKLPKNTAYFMDGKIQMLIAPVETLEQQIAFAETKASVAGQKLVEHHKQTLILMEAYHKELGEIVELKRKFKAENPEILETAS